MPKNPAPEAAAHQSASMQRLNVGVTLLAVIFLIVMAAAAGGRATRISPAVTPKGETLAVLGVTPGADLPTAPPSRTLSKQP